MPRQRIPSYRLHKPSGQARVIINGVHIYLGQFNSQKSRAKYAQLLAEHFGSGTFSADDRPPLPGELLPDLTVDELLVKYLGFAEGYYVKDGEPTKELTSMKEAMGHLRGMFGTDSALAFGPKKLKAVREHMIVAHNLSRGVINARINRIKRIFKWAVSEELVEPGAYHALQAVAGLKFGRTEARETEPVRPVADEHVDVILPNVAPQIAAMIRIQRLAGMRPEEVTRIRPTDIDRSGEIWIYSPDQHKKSWLGYPVRSNTNFVWGVNTDLDIGQQRSVCLKPIS